MSLLHPCKDCIVKMLCKEMCGKTIPNSLVNDTLMHIERCVDCGCTKGLSNIILMDTMRCKECRSMYYLTSTSDPSPRIDRKYKVHHFGAMEHYIDRTFAEYIDKMKKHIGVVR